VWTLVEDLLPENSLALLTNCIALQILKIATSRSGHAKYGSTPSLAKRAVLEAHVGGAP
jgi:hypothetical protein